MNGIFLRGKTMLPYLFDSPFLLLNGLIVGIILGFLLHKANLTHFDTIVGQFMLRDFTMIKVIMTAIFVGSLGIHLVLAMNLPISLQIKAVPLLAVIVGSAVIGIGIVILGYCPGTCVAAAGQGSKDAYWGLLGMLLGAAVYSEVQIFLQKNILSSSKITALRLPELLKVSPWLVIAAIGVLVIIMRIVSARNS
jgi:uncharacterized protein